MTARVPAQPSVYRVNAQRWLGHRAGGGECSDDTLARRLPPYVRGLGFSHIEWLAPVDDLPRLAARCAAEGLGVLAAPTGAAEPAEAAPVMLPQLDIDHADRARRFAARRARLALHWAAPGAVALTMGDEFAQDGVGDDLAWHLLADPLHEGVQRLVHDLNQLRREPWGELAWLQQGSGDGDVLVFARRATDASAPDLLVLANASTAARPAWRCGVPRAGRHVERIASASAQYGGGVEVWPNGSVTTEPVAWDGCAQSVVLALPALCTLILEGPR